MKPITERWYNLVKCYRKTIITPLLVALDSTSYNVLDYANIVFFSIYCQRVLPHSVNLNSRKLRRVESRGENVSMWRQAPAGRVASFRQMKSRGRPRLLWVQIFRSKRCYTPTPTRIAPPALQKGWYLCACVKVGLEQLKTAVQKNFYDFMFFFTEEIVIVTIYMNSTLFFCSVLKVYLKNRNIFRVLHMKGL